MLQKQWAKFSVDYNKKVFSLTSSPIRRQQIYDAIKPGKILNIRCGSMHFLNQGLLQYGEVIASDFCEEMIIKSKQNFQNTRLEYIVADTRNLPFSQNSFDDIVSTNSILPPERYQVIEMGKEIYRILKNNGKFIGFLPSFDCNEEVNAKEWGIVIDRENKRAFDTTGWQCFHTMDTIKQEIISAGFKEYKIIKLYLDSKEEISELQKIYGIDSSKKPIHEYFVVAIK